MSPAKWDSRPRSAPSFDKTAAQEVGFQGRDQLIKNRSISWFCRVWILCTWDGAHTLEWGINNARKKDGVGEQLDEVDGYKEVSDVISDVISTADTYNCGQVYEELLEIASD